jgi:hypothetical protein
MFINKIQIIWEKFSMFVSKSSFLSTTIRIPHSIRWKIHSCAPPRLCFLCPCAGADKDTVRAEPGSSSRIFDWKHLPHYWHHQTSRVALSFTLPPSNDFSFVLRCVGGCTANKHAVGARFLRVWRWNMTLHALPSWVLPVLG